MVCVYEKKKKKKKDTETWQQWSFSSSYEEARAARLVLGKWADLGGWPGDPDAGVVESVNHIEY